MPLVAVYPKEGTLASDNPYAVLDAPWVTAEKQAARRRLPRVPAAPPGQQQRFTDAGFRDAAGKPGAALQASKRCLLDQPQGRS